MPSRRPSPLRIIPAVHRAAHRIGVHLAGIRDLGVTQAEAHILDHLATHGDCTVGELHHAFAHRRSTLTSVLDRLVDRGLIVRESHAADRRTFQIRLTASGRTLAGRVHAMFEGIESRVLALASSRDREGLDAVLTALEQALARRRS